MAREPFISSIPSLVTGRGNAAWWRPRGGQVSPAQNTARCRVPTGPDIKATVSKTPNYSTRSGAAWARCARLPLRCSANCGQWTLWLLLERLTVTTGCSPSKYAICNFHLLHTRHASFSLLDAHSPWQFSSNFLGAKVTSSSVIYTFHWFIFANEIARSVNIFPFVLHLFQVPSLRVNWRHGHDRDTLHLVFGVLDTRSTQCSILHGPRPSLSTRELKCFARGIPSTPRLQLLLSQPETRGPTASTINRFSKRYKWWFALLLTWPLSSAG